MALTLDTDTLNAALVLLIDPHEWRHRRVDSVHLEAGERGRWRASVDCTPPRAAAIPYGDDQVVIPLAFVEKGPMRDLNVADDAGEPLPVLTSQENTGLAAGALLHLLAVEGVDVEARMPALGDAVRLLVGGTGQMLDVEGLLHHGFLGETQVFDPRDLQQISDVTRTLMRTLAQNFILGVVMDGDCLDRRQLIKFSYFWHVDPTKSGQSRGRTWLAITLGSFGFQRSLIALDVPHAGDAASFHLEVHPPEGLSCRVELPPMRFLRQSRGFSDSSPTSVGHAYGAYHQAELSTNLTDDVDVIGEAALELYVSRRGSWLMTLLLSLFTFLFFLFGLWFDGALYVLRGQGPSGGVDPSALLLTLPGVLVGLLVSAREHVLASVLLMPIRTAAVTCSALLLVAAASLTFQLRDPFLVPLWNLGLGIAAVILLALALGAAIRGRRTRIAPRVYS